MHSKHRRIAIVGLPGSGKSTFATKLGKELKLPVFHLDKLMFEGRSKRKRDEFLALHQSLIDQDSWIIEGCSTSTFESRFARADTVIYFGLHRLVCVGRVFKRLLSFDKALAQATGCLDTVNLPLLQYIWNFDRDKKPAIHDLIKRFDHLTFYELKNQKEVNACLHRLTRHTRHHD
jgi:adenylate kinase family enzyme